MYSIYFYTMRDSNRVGGRIFTTFKGGGGGRGRGMRTFFFFSPAAKTTYRPVYCLFLNVHGKVAW